MKTAEEYRVLFNASGEKVMELSGRITEVYKVLEEKRHRDGWGDQMVVFIADIYEALGDAE